jgi:hypothetical protein
VLPDRRGRAAGRGGWRSFRPDHASRPTCSLHGHRLGDPGDKQRRGRSRVRPCCLAFSGPRLRPYDPGDRAVRAAGNQGGWAGRARPPRPSGRPWPGDGHAPVIAGPRRGPDVRTNGNARRAEDPARAATGSRGQRAVCAEATRPSRMLTSGPRLIPDHPSAARVSERPGPRRGPGPHPCRRHPAGRGWWPGARAATPARRPPGYWANVLRWRFTNLPSPGLPSHWPFSTMTLPRDITMSLPPLTSSPS